MIILSPLKALTLTTPSHKNRHSHLSAASGLVQVGDLLYVVADDENHLGVFLRESNEHGYLKELFYGDLPLLHEERKAHKPDLEILTFIPASKKFPHGALLAMGSGSKKSRNKGVIMCFDHTESLQNDVTIIDLAFVYEGLKQEIGKLNIEGSVIVGEEIILFQRGNKKNNVNSAIRLPLQQFFDSIFHADKNHNLDLDITHYELGDIDGVPLCFTDATALPDGSIVFTAAAENTADAYLDGTCMGSAIGVITANKKLHSITVIDKVIKVEGVEAQVINNKIHLLLVTDADNEAMPAQVYSATLNGYPFT